MVERKSGAASVSRPAKAMLFCAAATLTVLAIQAQPAQAQTAPAQPTSVEEVVVTGSRIARAEVDQPTPIQVLGDDAVRRTGTEDVGQLLAQQPAVSFGGTQQAQQNTGTAGTPGAYTGGLALVNLRGLGTNRTLTLVNGKRQVGSDPGNTAFDLNSISSFAIQRVEVITGGASAVYGSDAVTGVVNIITRDDLKGFEVEARESRSEYGSMAETTGVALAGGTSFGGGRGSIMATLSWDHTNSYEQKDQPDSFSYQTVANPAYTATNGQPNTLLKPYVESLQVTYTGNLNYNGTPLQPGGIFFDATGKVTTPPTALAVGSLALYRQLAADCSYCFKTQDFYTLVPELTKEIGSVRGHYDLVNSGGFTATVYADGSYAHRESAGNGQPINSTSAPINVAQNAFLDPAARAQLQAAGVTTATLNKSWLDIGGRNSHDTRNTYQYNCGVKGKLINANEDKKYYAFLSYGRSDLSYKILNQADNPNLTAALDAVVDPATSQVACRVNVKALQPTTYVAPAIIGSAANCAPINPFGNTISAAAKAFVSLSTFDTATLDQTSAGLSVAGDTSKFFHLFGGAPVSFAGGYEYRKETDDFQFDPNEKNITTGATGVDSAAKYDVNEVYGEVEAPLLQDLPFAKLVSLNIAGRYADYSTVGGVESYKFAAIWAPTSDFRFRGTFSRAVRAPNLTEALSPTQTTSGIGSDPCTTTLRNTSAVRAANCTALGIPAVFAGRSTSIPLITSGNASLKPERSDSYTGGIVFTPTFLPRFTASIDYYNIKIKDAITLLTAAQIANACVDNATGPDPLFCNLVTRDPNAGTATYQQITSATSTYLNASKLVDRGIDFQASYRVPAFGGQIKANLVGTYIILRRNYLFQSNPVQYTRLDGYLGNPQFKINPSISFAYGPLNVTLSGRYFSHQSQIDQSPGQNRNFQDVVYMPSEYYQDVFVSYRLGRNEKITAYAGATNLFGNTLPPVTASLRNLTSAYDDEGRVFFVGLRMKY